jgi:hypothetical protein
MGMIVGQAHLLDDVIALVRRDFMTRMISQVFPSLSWTKKILQRALGYSKELH